jgi:hypothetical protein
MVTQSATMSACFTFEAFAYSAGEKDFEIHDF